MQMGFFPQLTNIWGQTYHANVSQLQLAVTEPMKYHEKGCVSCGRDQAVRVLMVLPCPLQRSISPLQNYCKTRSWNLLLRGRASSPCRADSRRSQTKTQPTTNISVWARRSRHSGFLPRVTSLTYLEAGEHTRRGADPCCLSWAGSEQRQSVASNSCSPDQWGYLARPVSRGCLRAGALSSPANSDFCIFQINTNQIGALRSFSFESHRSLTLLPTTAPLYFL